MQRRPWTPYQDQVLKNLFEKVKLNKWSLIARRMEEEHSLPPRTGKQCRQRYNNHLNPLVQRDNWSAEEQIQLLRLHDELGNKWAIIAAKLGGRTDNSVKNHFFAKLRKSMRKINKIITQTYRKQIKQIKLNVLYKIIEASEQRFKKTPLCTVQTSKYSCLLKNQILEFSEENLKVPQKEEFECLINKIHDFGKNYKRKPKQLRRVPSQGMDFTNQLISYPQEQSEQASDKEAGEAPQAELEDSEDEIVREENITVKQQKQIGQKKTLRSKQNANSATIEDKPKSSNRVQLFLQNEGLLEQSQDFAFPPPVLRHRASSDYLAEGQSREVFFLDESNGDQHLPTPLHISTPFRKNSDSEEFFQQ